MVLAICGLLFSLALYLAAIYGLVWSASRRVRYLEAQGVSTDDRWKFPSAREILIRHSGEWLLGFFVFFLLLGLADFPLWQRLGIGALAALYFGSIWFDQSGRNMDERVSAGRRLASNVWYWLLAVADWLGFMWLLGFASALVLEAV